MTKADIDKLIDLYTKKLKIAENNFKAANTKFAINDAKKDIAFLKRCLKNAKEYKIN